ncbi:PAS domain-containing sensor histidine kinase [Bacillus suaedaesalsae]|uniref:histidine kinase n=1 Tax=Bacillus suaedaesalsae TaxID=2810349 RepID=A0ABS2DHZ5_9BACI|nr:PAS domain-containing sensor histidine kinase [Bacillus suaedaesalsae]MBM6618109.1 PAS domain S-box protein [Bacillus suaedaesalsae]
MYTKQSSVIVVDELERMQQENKRLKDKLEQYRIMFEQSLDAIILFDDKTCFTEVNQAACDLFELPKEQLLGRSLSEFLILQSNEKSILDESILYSEGKLKGEITIRLRNGKVKIVEFSARKDTERGLDLSVMRDISSRKLLEHQRKISKQMFSDVYNRAVDGIVIFDRNGIFIDCNLSFMKSFDLQRVELNNKTSIYDFVEPKYLFKLEKQWKILDEKQRAKGELPVKLRNGTKKLFEFTTTSHIQDNYYMSIMRDVTEKRTMEQMLQKSELRFREIFDSALDAIVIWDQEGNIIRANESASKTFEMPNELLCKSRLLDFIDEHNPEVIKVLEDLKVTGKQRDELDFNMYNGQVKRLEFTSKYKVLDDYNMTIFRNVSERTLMEKHLREEEQKFRKIFEGTLDGILLWDENLQIIDVNPIACQIVKMNREELLGKNIAQIIPKETFHLCLSSKNKSMHSDNYIEIPITLIDGEERIIEYAIKEQIIPHLNMAIFRDVTERKQIEKTLRESEHKFRQLYDNTLNGFIIIDNHGTIVDMNKRAKKKFVLFEGQQNLKFQDFIYQNTQNKDEKWANLLQEESPTGQFVINDRIIEYTLNKNIYDDHHLAILNDVTRRIEMEERLKKSDTLNVVGELAAGIAHEIRNPMTALKGFIQLLEANVKEDFTLYFDVITSELKRIESIITEFLILAKPQAIQYQKRNIEKIVKDTVDLLTPQAALNNIQLYLNVEEELPELYCEPNQLKQVFINILKNGIEVMPEGGFISVSIHRDNKDTIKVSFQDRGCGIPKEKIKRLGEPFYTTKERGTGLGLMVSYKIISEHNGKIEVESTVGEGTTFHIMLPIHGIGIDV